MILRIIRSMAIVLFGSAAIFFLWFWNTAPGGIFHATWTPGKESPFIYGFGPSTALAETNDPANFQIKGERATFSLKLPAKFKEIEMEIDYDLPVAPIVRLLGKSGIGAIDFKECVLYAAAIEKKAGTYIKKDGFLVSGGSPEAATAATQGKMPVFTLGFRLEKNLGNGNAKNRRVNASLRGSHIFWLLPGGDAGNKIIFSVQDMNRHPEADPITIEVSSRDRTLKKITFEDNDASNNNLPGEVKDIKFFLPKFSGPLRVFFSASDDIFIRTLETDASRFVLEDRIFLGDDVGTGGKGTAPVLWTDGSFIRAKTPHREGLQKIFFANRQIDLGLTGEYRTSMLDSPPGGITTVRLQRNDVELVTSGFFAFSPDDFFTPAWPEVSWAGTAESQEVIVAKYESPRVSGGVLTSRVKFSTDELFAERDGSYRFFFDIPGAEELGGSVNIRQIKLTSRK